MTLSRRSFLAGGAALAAAALPRPVLAAPAKKKLVLLAGSPSHGPLEHEFNAGTRLIEKCLSQVEGLELSFHTGGWPADEKVFDGADGILSYCDGGKGHPFLRGNHLEVIGKLMKQGVGLMCCHYSVEVPADIGSKEFQEGIGGRPEHKEPGKPLWSAEVKEVPTHPHTSGGKAFPVRREWYFNMRFRAELKGVTPILSAKPSDAVREGPYVYPKGPYKHIQEAKGRAESMMWAVERADGGRGVGFTGGHFHKNWADDNYRKVVLNALFWICKMDIPKEGVASRVTEEDLVKNLDPKPPRKK